MCVAMYVCITLILRQACAYIAGLKITQANKNGIKTLGFQYFGFLFIYKKILEYKYLVDSFYGILKSKLFYLLPCKLSLLTLFAALDSF